MTPNPQTGTTRRTLSTPALVTQLLLQARQVEMLKRALEVQSNRIGVYEDCARIKSVRRSRGANARRGVGD